MDNIINDIKPLLHWEKRRQQAAKYIEGPITKLKIKEVLPEITMSDSIGNTVWELREKMCAQVVEKVDDMLLEEIMKLAELNGFTSVYLIDKEFVISALQHEIERRQMGG